MAEIRFEGVTKSFRDVRVIEQLDLAIHDGEFFTFVGPSGCGKSTILNMIAGLEPVTTGKIYFDNEPVNDVSPGGRDIAMVFQSYALYPHMTVHENIAFPLKMKKLARETIDREVTKTAAALGLEDYLQRKPRELSGGQRQRVALGRAIVRKPKVFLMDEPLSNLDARLRLDMRTELKRLHRELKITTVYVTHDQAEAMSLSDRMAVIHQGKIQQCGTPAEIYMGPSNVFVAGFIGSLPINFLPAELRTGELPEIVCNGTVLPLLTEGAPAGRDIMIGIRPEDIAVTRERAKDGIEVDISLLETVGSYNLIDALWGNIRIRGVSAPEVKLEAGQKAFMVIRMDRAVLFDAGTGNRIR